MRDTSSLESKKVINVEILHLDDLGYGPQGKHTRREWRAECLENFMAGKEQFEAWQAGWKDQIDLSLHILSFAAVLHYENGTQKTINREWFNLSEPYSLDFVAHVFKSRVNAENFAFEEAAIFVGATFASGSDFSNSAFSEEANFRHATFSGGYVIFSSTKFASSVSFSNAQFTGHAYFEDMLFKLRADFKNAVFSDLVDFRRTTFEDDADFSSGSNSRTEFRGDCYFGSATFLKNANFFKTQFNNNCRFDNNLIGSFQSKETSFEGAANFENTEVQNVGHFERVKFNGEIPNFLGVDNSKTLLIFSGDEYFNKNDTTEDAVKRLAQLKRLADEQGQTDQALMFNAFELNAKRAQAKAKTVHLAWKQKANNADYWFANATAAFRIFSDYGRSFFEPLKWYLALLGVTFYLAIAHAVYFTNKECPNEYANIFSYLWREQIQCTPVKPKDNETPILLSGWRAAVEYTSYRASGILDFADSDKQTIAISNRLFNQPIEPPWMRAWSIFKGIASIALLFLAALGLRNKYRIK